MSGSNLACPYCGNAGAKRELNNWIFASYEVTRLECENCKGKFNIYVSDGEMKFTIPRV